MQDKNVSAILAQGHTYRHKLQDPQNKRFPRARLHIRPIQYPQRNAT
jgi:hypothetical protein